MRIPPLNSIGFEWYDDNLKKIEEDKWLSSAKWTLLGSSTTIRRRLGKAVRVGTYPATRVQDCSEGKPFR